MSTRNRTFITSLTLMFSLFLYVFLQLYISSPAKTKQSFFSQAAGGNDFGFNIHSLPLLPPNQVAQTLSMAAQCSNTSIIRFWGFSGGDNIGKVLDNSPANMKFVIALSDFYKAGVNQPWPAPENDPTSWFSSDWKTNGYKTFIDSVTKKYSNHPKILVWELMNEPNCTADDSCTQAQHQFFRESSSLISQNSPKTLISPGTQTQITGGEHFDNGDFDDIASMPNITALSCHIQLGDDKSPLSEQKQNCITALEITKKYNKFFYTGEFGENMHCTERCVNTCDQNKLINRKNKIMSVLNELNNLGNNASIVWQFSPEQNPTLSCDGASVFPKDPFCSITGQTTLSETGGGNTGGAGGGGGNAGTTNGGLNNELSINFNPQNPKADDPNLTITIESSQIGYSFVYLKIFKKGEKETPVWMGADNLATEPSVSSGPPAKWTYHINLGKPIKALAAGEYDVYFYADCDTDCKSVLAIPRSLSVGTGVNNTVQTPQKTQAANIQGGKNIAVQPGNQEAAGNQTSAPQIAKCKEYKINGPKQSKYNLVFLPSGYQDRLAFLNDVKTSIDSLNKTNLNPNLISKINFYYYDDLNVDYQAGFCDHGICLNRNITNQYKDVCGGNGYALIINSDDSDKNKVGSAYGYCAGELAYSRALTERGLVHELGHSIACLEDEYTYPQGALQGNRISRRVNCSDQFSGNNSNACPGFEKYSDAGCFPGCRYPDWYRSTYKSVMGGGYVDNGTPLWDWNYNQVSLNEWNDKLQNFQ